MNIKPALGSINPSLRNVAPRNRVNFILAAIPIVAGLVMYWFLGTWIYETVMGYGNELIESYISEESWGAFFYYIVAALLSVMMFFLVNWTFVLAVALIASPFNDLLSSRIEKQMRGEALLPIGPSFKLLISKVFYILFNEIKKIAFIIALSVFSFLFGYIPLLAPVGVFIAILLLAVEFLDYSWSRHDLKFKECLSDLRGNMAGYAFGGAFFFMLVSIPIFNLLVPALATSYFTTLWVKYNGRVG